MKKTLFILAILSVLVFLPKMTLAYTLPGLAASVGSALVATALACAAIGLAVAAILFLTAAGSPEKISQAKAALFWGIVGVVVALIAGGAIGFVTSIIG
jgi:quinol-cytochrome oxidoreductase complex cytochrome b subunit